ncbi:MAG: PilZ domain-containing protein [Methylococcales bacterium]
MFQNRKEYRKSFTSPGQLYVAGETLAIVSYDVSVKGVLIEMIAGKLLASSYDVEELIKESLIAEIFVKDLMLSGIAHIVWARLNNGKLMVGLEFVDVQYNAQKLWRKRKYYRKKQSVSGFLINNDVHSEIATRDISVDGLMITIKSSDGYLDPGAVVKIVLAAMHMKAIAKILWIKKDDENAVIILGLRYLVID